MAGLVVPGRAPLSRRGPGPVLFIRPARADEAAVLSEHAEGFSSRCGAVRIGLAPSGSVAGRMLPLLRLDR